MLDAQPLLWRFLNSLTDLAPLPLLLLLPLLGLLPLLSLLLLLLFPPPYLLMYLRGGIGDGRLSLEGLICLLPPAALPERGMCCTNHLDPPPGCRVINSTGLVGVVADSSSKTKIDRWSSCWEGSVTTAFPFFTACCSAASSTSAASCSWNNSSKAPSRLST